MSILINIITIGTGIFLIGLIIYLMVNKKMTESQSVLWIVIGIVTVIIGIFPTIINYLANKLGVWYAPSISFLIAYIGLLFVVLKNTVITSIHSNQINELLINIVLVNKENEKLREKLESMKEEADAY